MGLITNILFPVDFSSSCVAMAAYVKRAATLLGAKVSLAFAAAVRSSEMLFVLAGLTTRAFAKVSRRY
jgi:hypothetical protein